MHILKSKKPLQTSSRQPRNLRLRKRSLRKLIETGSDFLEGHRIDQPRRNAEILLSHILKKPLHYVYTARNETASEDLARRYTKMLRERAVHKPVQYITEEADFFGRRFLVKKGVLIPRPETEILVEKTLGLYREHFKSGRVRILDIGTGCGNIAVSLAAEIDDCSVIATDISSRALKVASLNAAMHNVNDRIEFIRENLFPLSGDKFHIIVSNPPYIPHGEIPFLEEEVRMEPLRALDGGDDGMKVIRRILKRADAFLYAGGFLVMEIGCGQADSIRNMPYGIKPVSIEKDLAGIERIAIFRKKKHLTESA